jgi:oligopeptide transport system substrate-binding protein
MNATRLILLAALLFLPPPSALSSGADSFSDEWKRDFEPEDDSWKSVTQELIFNNGAEPETLDPGIMTGVPEHTLALALYEGLVSHDPETLEPRPGVAQTWTIDETKTIYTFRLRDDAKWSNGDPVTPEDFQWSWYRALCDPECDYAYLFYYIEGAEQFHKDTIETLGKTEKPLPFEEFQKRVRIATADPRTLVVSLNDPTPYFLDLCAFETYMPVHRATFKKHGDRWTRPENWVGNGPFLLTEWKPRDRIVMTPNPHYWDAGFVKLTKITALPIDDMDVSYNKFLKKEVHWIRSVPTAKLDEAKRNPEYFVQPYLGSYFYRVNVDPEKGPKHLQDKRIRQALSVAIDRETITRDVTRAGQTPATWFCPAMTLAQYEPPKGLAYNPERARALLKEGMAALGLTEFPKLTLFYNTSEDHKKTAERVAQMWRENLGIKVSLQNSEWKVYLNEVENLNYEIARAGWIGDYEDPMTFLDMWLTGGGNNNTGWSSARYDALIAQARKEPDLAKRAALLREAEAIVVEDDFPIIPLYIYVNQGMKVDALQGWYETVRDLHPFQYMYFEPAE